MVTIIDYGVGNLLAIKNIIRRVKGQAIITNKVEDIVSASKIILPGVGAFGFGVRKLRSLDLIDPLNDAAISRRIPILGLCLGAQLMTKFSEEDNEIGLCWVEGSTVRFNQAYVSTIPHMGWSEIEFIKESPLTKDIINPRFYFAHSYHFDFSNEKPITGLAHYGYRFPCSFQSDNIFGVQFHPEKSHRFGMKLFENFLKL